MKPPREIGGETFQVALITWMFVAGGCAPDATRRSQSPTNSPTYSQGYMYDPVQRLDMMRRRTVVRRAGIGLTAFAVPGVSGCLGGDDGSDTQTQSLPELDVSSRSIDSSVAELSVVGHEVEFLRGQQHEDIHFGVTPTVENTGDQQANLDAYQYDIALYSADDIDITPGRTWTADAEQVPAGETGTVLLQVSFLDAEGVNPEDVDQYGVSLSCGGDSDGTYC